MQNHPFNGRHVAYSDNKQQGITPIQEQLQDLSPDLSLLLSLVLKDKHQSNIIPMLKSIEPFLDPNDRSRVGNILGMSEQAQRLRTYNNTHSMNTGYQNLSKYDRQTALLDQLLRFAKGDSKKMMNQMTNFLKKQHDMNKMMKQVDDMQKGETNDPMAMFELLSMFMPNNQLGEIKNMQNMMNMFKNMNGGDMSSIMKNFMK